MADYRKEQDLVFQEMQDRAAIAEMAKADADFRALIEKYGERNLLRAYRATLKAGGKWDINRFIAELISKETPADG